MKYETYNEILKTELKRNENREYFDFFCFKKYGSRDSALNVYSFTINRLFNNLSTITNSDKIINEIYGIIIEKFGLETGLKIRDKIIDWS